MLMSNLIFFCSLIFNFCKLNIKILLPELSFIQKMLFAHFITIFLNNFMRCPFTKIAGHIIRYLKSVK